VIVRAGNGRIVEWRSYLEDTASLEERGLLDSD
jgi:hypothetical protein